MVRMYAFEEMANAVKIVPARLGENCVALGPPRLSSATFSPACKSIPSTSHPKQKQDEK